VPEDLDKVAALPGVEASIVIIWPDVPVATKLDTVVVTPLGNVTWPSAFIVNVLNMLAPVMMTAPLLAAPDIVILLYVLAPPANILDVADVSVINIVDALQVNVRLVAVDTSHIVPVPESVHVPEPMVIDLVFSLLEVNAAIDIFWLLASNVPDVRVSVPVQVIVPAAVKVVPA